MEEKPLIYDMDFPDLEKTILEWNEPSYRTRQLWQGIYQNLWDRIDQFTTLPLTLRRRLNDSYNWEGIKPVSSLVSSDGETRKTLFRLTDKHTIEAVIMRYYRRDSLCISTQAGCAMGCVFCATGQMGFRRHLSSGEMVEQVLYFARQLLTESAQSKVEKRITNVVMMGMGEPFHNYENVISAIKRLSHSEGFGLGSRRFTISTIGLIPGLRRFTKEKSQVNLAVSLHAVEDELRSSLIPINRKYPVADLMSTCLEYVETTNRRITFEWALIHGLNDTIEQANKLAHLLQPFRRTGVALCHVNVIPLNPTLQYSGRATTPQRARVFQAILKRHGIPCTVRLRRGIDIMAGCGQLASEKDHQPLL